MKKLTLLFAVLVSGMLAAQTLTVPKTVIQVNTSDLQANMWAEFQNWTNGTDLVAIGSIGENAVYGIKASWWPTNSELNEVYSLGGNTSNFVLYLKVADSLFFADTVPPYITGNATKVQGKNSIVKKTWGDYFDESHEMYFNTFNGQYIILASDDLGNRLPLSTVIKLRNDYAKITGYYTYPGLMSLTQSNLIKRANW